MQQRLPLHPLCFCGKAIVRWDSISNLIMIGGSNAACQGDVLQSQQMALVFYCEPDLLTSVKHLHASYFKFIREIGPGSGHVKWHWGVAIP